MSIGAQTKVHGPALVVNGAGTLTLGNKVELGDGAQAGVISAIAGGPVRLGPHARLTGFLQPAESVSEGAGATVLLGILPPKAFPALRTFTIRADFPPPLAAVTVAPGQHHTLAAGASYVSLTARPNATVHIAAGRYHLGDITFASNSVLDIDDSVGEVMIFVAGDFSFDGRVQFRRGPEHVAIVQTDAGNIAINDKFSGTVLAPLAVVSFKGGHSTFEGGYLGRSIAIGPNDIIKSRKFEGWGELLCEKAAGPTTEQALALPTVCNKASECCSSKLTRLELSDDVDRHDIQMPNTCLVANGGDDAITGCKIAGSFVLGGGGNDDIQLGQGVVAYGGPGNDRIETFGNATLFGNAGDDILIAHTGTNVIIPGPGSDHIRTGSGDDTVVLFDACEATAGKIIDLGGGNDTVLSPLTRAELEANGVKLVGVEEVRISSDPCRSECRNPPRCRSGGACAVQSDLTLGCACPPTAAGPLCETPRDLPFDRRSPPRLDGATDSVRLQQTRNFTSWFVNGLVAERDAARAALDGTRGNLPIRDAFAITGGELLSTRRYESHMAVVEILGYLGCAKCLDVLMEHFPSQLPSATADDVDGPNRGRAVQSMMAQELAWSRTKKTRDFLLGRAASHTDQIVRRSVIFALAQAYGPSVRGAVASAARPADMAAFDLIDNADPEFDIKYRARWTR